MLKLSLFTISISDIIGYGVNNYVDILKIDNIHELNVYYFDDLGSFRFLPEKSYDVISDSKIRLYRDGNLITTPNDINEFWVSFAPKYNDIEFVSYRFSYDPTQNLTETLDVTNWEVIGSDNTHVVPNIDAPYYMNGDETTFTNFVCHASQIATYISSGDKLSFDIKNEFNSYYIDDDLTLYSDIASGNYLSLYMDTTIQNYESLEKLIIHLQDSNRENITVDQEISLEELIMYDFDVKIDLSGVSSSLRYIEFEPVFRNDSEYSESNVNGVAHFEFAEWNEQMSFYDSNGNKVMNFTLDNILLTNPTGLNLAYLYNEYLDYLELPDGVEIGWGMTKDIYGNNNSYVLQIPNTYKNPDNQSEILSFKDGDIIIIRYNSPTPKQIGIGIGKMYFEKRPYDYNPSIPIAECLFVNVSDSADYSLFTDSGSYNYQIPLRLTPFDTEYSNSFKIVEFNI
ncbi:unnamed protein product, partial [marine sediment metagenome]